MLESTDYIYGGEHWDSAPIVLEDFKLVFFTTPKVGCTTWKQLFRRMMGYSNWRAENTGNMLPWNPKTNGLKYLYHYNLTYASEIMSSPEWTRAIFVRDPKERFLSAYLDKAVKNRDYLARKCCQWKKECIQSAKASLEGFFELAQECPDPHWAPQHNRVDEKFWPAINFVGHMETMAEDAEKLLLQVGAWEYGQSGWGKDGKQAIFRAEGGESGRKHATNAKENMQAYFTPRLEAKVDLYYGKDYRNAVLDRQKVTIF